MGIVCGKERLKADLRLETGFGAMDSERLMERFGHSEGFSIIVYSLDETAKPEPEESSDESSSSDEEVIQKTAAQKKKERDRYIMSVDGAEEFIRFWFALDGPPMIWFKEDHPFHKEMADRFMRHYELAAAGKLKEWRTTAYGACAEIILLDEFPRKVFKGTKKAFATDKMALELAKEAVKKGYHDIKDPYNVCLPGETVDEYGNITATELATEHQRASFRKSDRISAEISPTNASSQDSGDETIGIASSASESSSAGTEKGSQTSSTITFKRRKQKVNRGKVADVDDDKVSDKNSKGERIRIEQPKKKPLPTRGQGAVSRLLFGTSKTVFIDESDDAAAVEDGTISESSASTLIDEDKNSKMYPYAAEPIENVVRMIEDIIADPMFKVFLLMPFIHSEDAKEHTFVIEEAKKAKGGNDRTKNQWLKSTYLHHNIVQNFGRYPTRNEIFGRKSTWEEQEFLDESELVWTFFQNGERNNIGSI